MDRYVISFTLGSDMFQKSYIVFCDNQMGVAAVVARAEGAGFNLSSVARLSNVYDLDEFLKLLNSKGNGTDLLFVYSSCTGNAAGFLGKPFGEGLPYRHLSYSEQPDCLARNMHCGGRAG